MSFSYLFSFVELGLKTTAENIPNFDVQGNPWKRRFIRVFLKKGL
jgi:hypothetical protein